MGSEWSRSTLLERVFCVLCGRLRNSARKHRICCWVGDPSSAPRGAAPLRSKKAVATKSVDRLGVAALDDHRY